MLLSLQQLAYVRRLCEVKVRVYACRTCIGYVCLCTFPEKKKNSQAKKEGITGMEDQNPY
jgi:hypothetical protein